MSSFLFEGAFTRLASLDAADYSNLRVALVETAPTVTDEFAADLDETAAANYARKTPTGGALTQTAGKTLVTGTIPTWSALGTAEVLTHWVLFYNTGSDATSWLIAAVSLNHTCNGGGLTISTSGFLVDPTITRAAGDGTAAGTTYDDTGNTYVTGADVQAALDATESTLGTVATALGTAAATTTQSNNIDTYLHTVAVTATGGAVTLPLTKSLQVYDLDPADNPWTFTLPDLTAASKAVELHLFIYAKTGGNVALSFVSAGAAQDVVWSGPAPSEVPEEGYIVVRAQGDVGASGKWNMEWGSNIDGWGLTGHSATVASGTHLFSHAFEHVTLTGSDVTLTRDLTDAGGGSGMFWLKITNSSGSTRTITWGPTITWVAGSAVSTIANGATVLVMLQTLDSGATATGVNVTGLASSGSVATDTIFDAKGDLPVGTGSDTAAKLTAGSNNDFLIADSGEATGLKWVGGSTARTALGLGTVATLASDTDGTLAANSDSNVATQKAVKTYADTKAKPARWHSIDVAIPPLVTGTYTFGGTISGVNGCYMATASTNDQALEWELDFDGGTWRCDLVFRSLTSGGIATVYIDGSSVGTIDTYAASAANNNYGSITGITVAAGRHTLKIANPTKNGSSSNYSLAPQSLGLRRTGA